MQRKAEENKTPDEKTLLEREISATDQQTCPAKLQQSRIADLVYELYSLTEDKVRIMESAT